MNIEFFGTVDDLSIGEVNPISLTVYEMTDVEPFYDPEAGTEIWSPVSSMLSAFVSVSGTTAEALFHIDLGEWSDDYINGGDESLNDPVFNVDRDSSANFLIIFKGETSVSVDGRRRILEARTILSDDSTTELGAAGTSITVTNNLVSSSSAVHVSFFTFVALFLSVARYFF
jgi:hypothetical protein